MSFLGFRNAVSIGVSQHVTMGGPNLLNKLSPSLLLNFAGAETLDPRITFTRATTATFTGSNGLIQTAAIDAPRFDYDPTTLAPLGLLIEEQRTNLLLQSEACDVFPWVTAAPYSVSANAAISPDGTQNADALIVASGSSSFTTNVTRQVVTKAASAIQYTRSGYYKALGATTTVRMNDFAVSGANSATAIVSLINGSIIGAAAAAGTFSGASVAVTNAGNGWWRVALTYTTDAAIALTIRSFPYVGASPLTGDGTSGLLVYGAQLEAGAFPTSYIPTVASQVTRSADVAIMTGTNFSSWFNATEGTLYAEYQVTAGTNQRAFTVSDGTLSNVMNILVTNASGNGSSFAVTTAGSLVASVPTNLATQSATLYKVAGAYKTNDVNGARNGTVGTTDTSAAIPTVDRALIGAGGAASQFLNGYIRQIAFYPRRLANSELQAITA